MPILAAIVLVHVLAAIFYPVAGNFIWFLDSIVLILVVLIQRGRGGGLAGALGGMGGHSAFGTRTGDIMTAVTVVVFGIWLTMAMVLVPSMSQRSLYTGAKDRDESSAVQSQSEDTGIQKIDNDSVDSSQTPADPGIRPPSGGEKKKPEL